MAENTHENSAILDYFAEKDEASRKKLLDRIDILRKRIFKKDDAIEELQYERGLIFSDLCRTIREDLRDSSFNLFRYFNSEMLWKAWRWSHYKADLDKDLKDGKLTKDEHRQYKSCFDHATKTVHDTFFGELGGQVKFKELLMAWSVGYDFVYIYKDQEITVFVPIFNADERDYEYTLNGYRANYRESEYYSSYICSGLDYRSVAEQLQKWLKEEGWKKPE